MGKRSRLEMTGLSEEKRVDASKKRKIEENKRRIKEALKVVQNIAANVTIRRKEPPHIWSSFGTSFNPRMGKLLGLERARKKKRPVLKQKRKK